MTRTTDRPAGLILCQWLRGAARQRLAGSVVGWLRDVRGVRGEGRAVGWPRTCTQLPDRAPLPGQPGLELSETPDVL